MMQDIPLEYYTERGCEVPSPTFIPGEDFDPYDPDEVEAVKLAMQRSLAQEVQSLRERLAHYEQTRTHEDALDGYWEEGE